MPKGVPADLVGERFGSWTVLRKLDVYPYGQVKWACICDCGRTAEITTSNLVGRKSTGCRACGARIGHATRRARQQN